MKTLIAVAINDFRLVFRDNSLKIFIALPLLILLFIRYAVPYISASFEALGDYIALILMLATMQGPTVFGFIYSMVLVDEKDTGVASVYGILPVSKFWFVVFRLIPPYLLATLATVFLLLAEPFYGLPPVFILAYSALAALVTPLMILFVAIMARNKIEAMTWQKLFNLPLFLPVLTFFVPAAYSIIFAVSPAYWSYRTLDAMITGGTSWHYLLTGLACSFLILVWMIRRFTRGHFR